jgi:hypothetical protein
MRALALGCLLLTPLAASAKDWDFRDAVEDLERHLGARRLRIPLWGVMKFIGYPVYRPLGVKDFDMAIFEDVPERLEEEPSLLRRLGPGWRPVLRVRERHGDHVYLYARDEGSWIRMVMLTVDRNDAVLMHFKMRPSGFLVYVAKTARGGG